ncbi:serine/threonine protein kinase [Minicystis rosea]|nr:serine/threonine protein kinase [Minicystis rosea]
MMEEGPPMSAQPDVSLDHTVPLPISGVNAITTGPRAAAFDSRTDVRIDHFVIERKLGAGGMGAIYLARDEALDRPVAVKILPDELAREPGAQERFIREAQAQARLSSPHVVQIFFIGRIHPPPSAPGSLYFAMELVDGESLDSLLVRGEKLEPELARRHMVEAARGLADAHRAGIVHRDVKPGNLLVDRAGHLKIADFGLAKPREKNLSLTQDGAVMGTPYYMAPEQALGEPVDLRADMYALGCTFHHLLAGEPPFDGPNPTVVIAHHLKSEPPSLRERVPAVPPKLAEIVARLMKKEPVDRYHTYEALIDALEAAAPTRVEHAGFWARTAAVALDGISASLMIGLLGFPGLVVHIAYVTAAHAFYGQTAGKYVLRLQVQREDGTRLGLGRALLRTVIAMWLPFLIGLGSIWTQGFGSFEVTVTQLSKLDAARALVVPMLLGNVALALLWGGGLVVAAFDRKKRAVHDFVVGSRVVYRLGSPKLEMLPAQPSTPT